MRNKITLISIIFIFISCQNLEKESENKNSLFENQNFNNILTEYIDSQEKDKLPKTLDYKILKAINENDSLIINELENKLASYKTRKILDSTYFWLGVPLSLTQLDTSIKQAFRFYYQHSFDEKLLMITVKSSLEKYWVESIEYKMPCSPLTKPNEYNKDCLTVLRKTEFQLTAKKWEKLKRLLYQAEYWYLPFDNGTIGLDGSSWSLVGLDREYNQHHCVFRWSPPKGNDFREICEYLIEIAGANIEREY